MTIIPNDISERNPSNLYIFMTYSENNQGTVGIAYVGTVCRSDNQAYLRASISQYLEDDITTAEIVAHEIGHNLNMSHDFSHVLFSGTKIPRYCPIDGLTCTDVNGIMDYFEEGPLSWSCCSRLDHPKKYESCQIKNT